MIYDEGFEINIDETKYFAFSKYFSNNNGEFESDCSTTLVGWYNNMKTGDRGCYRAEKLQKSGPTANVKQDKVVQPKTIVSTPTVAVTPAPVVI